MILEQKAMAKHVVASKRHGRGNSIDRVVGKIGVE